MGNEVTLYSKGDCPRCVALLGQIKKREKVLGERGYTLVVKKMDEDETALDEALAAGVQSAPALLVEGTWLKTMDQALKWLKQAAA